MLYFYPGDLTYERVGFEHKPQILRPGPGTTQNLILSEKDVKYLLTHLRGIALKLQPIMPETAEEILRLIKENKTPEKPLFLRV